MYCTISSISESPVTAGVIWVGTDDGKVWITRDHGRTWLGRMNNLQAAGAPEERYVSRIFASHHKESRGYVLKSGFRNDDFKPYLYKSDDYGNSWTDISSNLHDQCISAFWEDDKNPDLLFIGNDQGVYFSLNKGTTWIPLKNNMPNVPIKDIAVHPVTRDLVVGTYGRGVYVTDIYPFLEFTQLFPERRYDVIQAGFIMECLEHLFTHRYGTGGIWHIFFVKDRNTGLFNALVQFSGECCFQFG